MIFFIATSFAFKTFVFPLYYEPIRHAHKNWATNASLSMLRPGIEIGLRMALPSLLRRGNPMSTCSCITYDACKPGPAFDHRLRSIFPDRPSDLETKTLHAMQSDRRGGEFSALRLSMSREVEKRDLGTVCQARFAPPVREKKSSSVSCCLF